MMHESYGEWLVTRKEPSYALAVRGLMGALVAVAVYVALMGNFGLLGILLLVAAVILAYRVFQSFRIEYEYLFVSGTLTIDKIIAKSRRKKEAEYQVEEIQLIAPCGSDALQAYETRINKQQDFSSGTSTKDCYAVICQKGAQTIKVILEPDQKMIHCFMMSMPGKVKSN